MCLNVCVGNYLPVTQQCTSGMYSGKKTPCSPQSDVSHSTHRHIIYTLIKQLSTCKK